MKSARDLQAALTYADGVVVGSALINAISAGSAETAAERAALFWDQLCA